MSNPWDDLYAAFSRGLDVGETELPEAERDLFYILLFISDFEAGGLLYNWTPEWERFDATIGAMRRRGLSELADIVEEIRQLLTPLGAIQQDLRERGEASTWSEILDLVDPDGRLDVLQDRIANLDDYGLPETW